MKRETSSFQQQHQRDTNLIDRANDLALDNLNVIYDNDTEHIDLGTATLSPASSSSAPPGGQPQQQQQQQHQPGESKAPPAAKSSFVHGEHGDEVQEPQDTYATCALEASSGAPAASLVGRLNFWQPIQNRGALHMIARLRYEPAEGPAARRPKRESYQTLIERVAPVGQGANETAARQQQEQVHQVWLLDQRQADCGGAGAQPTASGRTLMAELKPTQAANGTVDVDAELVVAKFNLAAAGAADANSILDRCLQLELGPARALAWCRIIPSQTLPPAGELESVGALQAVREELLMRASSPAPEV